MYSTCSFLHNRLPRPMGFKRQSSFEVEQRARWFSLSLSSCCGGLCWYVHWTRSLPSGANTLALLGKETQQSHCPCYRGGKVVNFFRLHNSKTYLDQRKVEGLQERGFLPTSLDHWLSVLKWLYCTLVFMTKPISSIVWAVGIWRVTSVDKGFGGEVHVK